VATIRTRIAKWPVQVGSKGSPPVGRSFTARRDAVEWARQIKARQTVAALVQIPVS